MSGSHCIVVLASGTQRGERTVQRLHHVVAAALLVGFGVPLTANAQEEFFSATYQSAPLTGTYETLVSGLPSSDPFVIAPFTGTINASFTGDANLSEVGIIGFAATYSFVLTGSGGTTTYFTSAQQVDVYSGDCGSEPNCIGVYSNNGLITNANVNLINTFVPGQSTALSIGPQGDNATADYRGNCDASAVPGRVGPTYTGPSSFCYVTASSTAAGTWKITPIGTPEIDPGAATTGLTLLAGLGAMLRGRRRGAASNP